MSHRWLARMSPHLALAAALAAAPAHAGFTVTGLGTLNGGYSQAYGINDAGQVVGYSSTAGSSATHAFLYSGGVMIDLGTLNGGYSEAFGINDAGQVAGFSDGRAFLYSGGSMTSLGTLGGSYSGAYGINDAGQVVGYSYTAGDSEYHAFLHSGGSMTDLGTLGGSFSYARAINNTGQVVGTSYTAGDSEYHAFLYSGGSMTDLNSLISPSSGWILGGATAINGNGEIVGWGFHNGLYEAFLLRPETTTTPAPPTVLLGAIGGLGLIGHRRRQRGR